MKNDSFLMEEMLRNKFLECKVFNDSLYYFNREQNRCFRKIKIVLDCLQNKGMVGILNKVYFVLFI